MDARLQEAWDEGQPMLEELAGELQVLPSRALGRLILKGIAYDTGEVEQRLGLHPDQDIAARLRLSVDKTSVQLWVLVVTDGDCVAVHLSLHAQLAGAEAALEELRPASDDEPLDGPRNWQILPRVVGEPVNRNGLSGTFYPSPAEPEQDVIEQRPKRARRPRKPRAHRRPRGLTDDDSVAVPRPPDNGALVAPDA